MKIAHSVLDELRANSPFDMVDELIVSMRPLWLIDQLLTQTERLFKGLEERQKSLDLVMLQDTSCMDATQLQTTSNLIHQLREGSDAFRGEIENIKDRQGKILKMLPSGEITSQRFDELLRRIEVVTSLADKFKEEMRINALHLKGKRRDAYAVDCWYIINELTDVCNMVTNYSEQHADSQEANTQNFSTLLTNAVHFHIFPSGIYSTAISRMEDAFNDYFPNTKTVLSEDNEYHRSLSEEIKKIEEFNGGVTPKSVEEWADIQRKMKSSAQGNQEPVPTVPGLKLEWNGAANTLYNVFRQLKNHHLPTGQSLIEENYDIIARFIQQSFVGYDVVSIATIRGRLTKNDQPKKSFNRIDIDLTEPN